MYSTKRRKRRRRRSKKFVHACIRIIVCGWFLSISQNIMAFNSLWRWFVSLYCTIALMYRSTHMFKCVCNRLNDSMNVCVFLFDCMRFLCSTICESMCQHVVCFVQFDGSMLMLKLCFFAPIHTGERNWKSTLHLTSWLFHTSYRHFEWLFTHTTSLYHFSHTHTLYHLNKKAQYWNCSAIDDINVNVYAHVYVWVWVWVRVRLCVRFAFFIFVKCREIYWSQCKNIDSFACKLCVSVYCCRHIHVACTWSSLSSKFSSYILIHMHIIHIYIYMSMDVLCVFFRSFDCVCILCRAVVVVFYYKT